MLQNEDLRLLLATIRADTADPGPNLPNFGNFLANILGNIASSLRFFLVGRASERSRRRPRTGERVAWAPSPNPPRATSRLAMLIVIRTWIASGALGTNGRFAPSVAPAASERGDAG